MKSTGTSDMRLNAITGRKLTGRGTHHGCKPLIQLPCETLLGRALGGIPGCPVRCPKSPAH
eukprot:5282375-Amphidinium_carterae.5